MTVKEIKRIEKLRTENFTYESIGKIFGVSKQRIHQVLKEYKKPSNNRLYGNFRNEGRDFLREKVRRRDNHKCQKCGRNWEEGKRRLDVHHLNEKEEGKSGFLYENNKDLRKMITLCHRCHLNLHTVKQKMKKL